MFHLGHSRPFAHKVGAVLWMLLVVLFVPRAGRCFTLVRCVDTSPLPFHKDAAATDGSVGDAAVIEQCKRCVVDVGAPCREQYDACVGIPKCEPSLECLFDSGCFEFASIQDRVQCGLPCLTAQGVLAGNDPTTQALAQMNVCIATSCKDACFVK
jgi:hypothetical protein